MLRYVDALAAHKLNVPHLHLTDDQGWRVEIKRCPRLTEVGAWRPRTRPGWGEPALWDERPHGGFHTQDDLREIVTYATERHVRIVPEIDLPGHSQAAVAAYPELGNTDVVDTGAPAVKTDWGISPHVLAPGAAVMCRRWYTGGVAAAEAGHDVVMCPQQEVYLDHVQSADAGEPVPFGWVHTLENVYRFEPVPPR